MCHSVCLRQYTSERHPDPAASLASPAGISGLCNPSFLIKQAAVGSELHFTEPGLDSELVDVTGNVQVPKLDWHYMDLTIYIYIYPRAGPADYWGASVLLQALTGPVA